ncbi:MAG TPA: hypothetical protein VF875_13875 [Anaeromyxobacter sp.]
MPRRLVAVILAPLLASAVLAGCGDPPPATGPARAFYFWRTRLDLSPAEHDALVRLRVRRLLVRFFDVAWSPEAAAPRPIAVVDLPAGAVPAGVELVPVVFLRTEVFERVGAPDLPALAERVARQVRAIAGAAGLSFRELQVDCDWDLSERNVRHHGEPALEALFLSFR